MKLFLDKNILNSFRKSSLTKEECHLLMNKHFGAFPLIEFLRHNFPLDVLKIILDHEADIINQVDLCWDSCLHAAFKYDHDFAVIILLLERGADVNKGCGTFDRSPLIYELHKTISRIEMIRLLIAYGADVNRSDCFGYGALNTAIVQQKEAKIIKLLLEAGAIVDKNRPTLIILLDWKNVNELETSLLVKLLIDYGANVNCEDWDGKTPLAVAIKNSRSKNVIQALLEGGANVNTVFEVDDETPLSMLLQSEICSVDTVKLLLDYKADVNYAIEEKGSPLKIAISSSRGKEIIHALLDKGANVEDNTSLVLAIQHFANHGPYDWEVIEELLFAGARIGHEESCDGLTILHHVLREYDVDKDEKKFDCFKILVQFFFLQNPQFDLEDCKRVSDKDRKFESTFNKEEFRQFTTNCLNELKEMESIQIGEGFTLREFSMINMPSLDSTNIKDTSVKTLDKLFRNISDNVFNVYFDYLVAKLDRTIWEKALSHIEVSASKSNSEAEKIYLDGDILSKISSCLTKEDLISFILASSNSKSKYTGNNMLKRKRSLESTIKPQKIPKLTRKYTECEKVFREFLKNRKT